MRQWAVQNPLMIGVACIVAVVVAMAAVGGDWTGAAVALLGIVVLCTVHQFVDVGTEDIIVGVWPVWRRVIPVRDVLSAHVETWRPLRDFGGWGIRFGRNATLYNMRGRRGVRLVLDGRHVVIGADDPEALLGQLQGVGVRTI